MGVPKRVKFAQQWAETVSIELEGFVHLTEQHLIARRDAIAANVTGMQNADVSVANPQVAVGALCDNAAFIKGNTYAVNGRTPPEASADSAILTNP